ncbi:hypothetical protein J7K24_03145 [bacterium]|nr:hypothetical protein [bacterium]
MNFKDFFSNKPPYVVAIIAIVIGLIAGGTGVYLYLSQNQGSNTSALSPQVAAQKAIDFINKNMLREGVKASLIDVVEQSGLYKIKFKIENQEFESYVSRDGQLLFVQGVKIEEEQQASAANQNSQPAEKRDTPDIKLFVMSYCPFGLQAEKAFLPVYDLLKGKANMGIYFVNYAMHGKKEIDENLRQYCIQKEQNEKYAKYLACFVKEGNYQECLSQAGVDVAKLSTCVSAADNQYKITEKYNDKSTWLSGRFPLFGIHDDLNEQYGVQGSPTLVINDKIVSVGSRSPEAFKKVICDAFNNPPEECSQTLSDKVASPGFGGGEGSSSGGGCGQ